MSADSGLDEAARTRPVSWLLAPGSRGLTELKGLLLGSGSHKVIQLPDAPVLTIR
jgi:nucleotide-binding universal stress UspA family protein